MKNSERFKMKINCLFYRRQKAVVSSKLDNQYCFADNFKKLLNKQELLIQKSCVENNFY